MVIDYSVERKEEGGRILAVLWAIWLPPEQGAVQGRMSSTDIVVQDVEGLIASWFHCTL